ncbi:hypothetical protein ACFSGI_07480 [Paenibacillus nicotianae]|uniref:Uncharacterized protein n=1 Tax=Paenibacillus nicotianae TaxID=1526551 RepID=A0ABW4UQT0_9BACL
MSQIWNNIKNSGVWMLTEKVLSIIAIIISTATFSYTIVQSFQSSSENLVIYSYQPDKDFKIKIEKFTTIPDHYSIPFQFKILLANTGEKTLTLARFSSTFFQQEDLGYSGLTDTGFFTEDN